MFKGVVMKLFSVIFSLLLASSSFAHNNGNGFGFFALEVPEDVTMTIDGGDADWTWFDEAFIVTQDEMFDVITEVIPPRDDLDIAVKTAWTRSPDNRVYGFYRVSDDTLNVDETDPENGWREDDLEIVFDADHSGGPFEEPAGENGQQYTMHMAVPGGYDTPYGNGTAWLRFQVDPAKQWSTAQWEADVGVSPAGATHGSTNVILGYEFAAPLFTIVANDEAGSPRHELVAGQTIGLTYQLNEADSADRTHQLTTSGANGAHWNADFVSDYTLLAIGEYTPGEGTATAVENSSWGNIKATFGE
jgi:hypothetical protein